VGEGWRAVRSRSWLLTYAIHTALLNGLAVAPFLVLGPLVAERHLGGAPSWAAIGVGYAGGGLAGNAVVLRWRPRRPMAATLLSAMALAPLLAILALPGPLWLLVVAAIAAGGQSGVYNTVGTSTLLTNVDERLVSRVSSFVMVGGLLGVPAGMGLAGAAADAFGARVVLIFGAASVVVVTLAALSVPSVWDGRLRSPG
jgi:predicted MFS family arabinose efflux permease